MENTALKVLTASQAGILTSILDRIIPEAGKMPSAGSLGITAFFDKVLDVAPYQRKFILGGITQLEILSWRQHEASFMDLSDADKDALLSEMEKDEKEFFSLLVRVTYNGYYTDAKVFAAMGWELPDESGYEVPVFDENVLDQVRQRGPIFVDIKD